MLGTINNFISYAKKISQEHEVWQIAFRKKGGVPLYKGNGNNFILVKNSNRYWRADPFVFKYNDKNYLFAELYDRKKQKGVLGVAKLTGNKCSRFKVFLDLQYHLSYPCIYENSEGVFMIPECCESGKISIYKCIDFPHKWEIYKTIKNIAAVDTTPIFDKNGFPMAYLSSEFDTDSGGNNNLLGINKKLDVTNIYSDNTTCRCAGHLINDNVLLRPVQDDTSTYGNCMYFYIIDNSDIVDFKEHQYIRVLPPCRTENNADITISLVENPKNLEFIGVHTYNSNSDYEVIDLLVKKQANGVVFWRNKGKLINKYIKKLKR